MTLNLSAEETGSGMGLMCFSDDGKLSTKKWTLRKGKAGARTVFVQFADRAGNVSVTAKDTIRYRPWSRP